MQALLLLGGAALAWWLLSKKDATPGTGGPRELEVPQTGVRWYPVPLASLGLKSESGEAIGVSPETVAVGSDVYFALEHGPSSERRLMRAMVNDVGLMSGKPAVLATTVEDAGALSLTRNEPAPLNTFVVLKGDLISPKVASVIQSMQISV